jgi:transposase
MVAIKLSEIQKNKIMNFLRTCSGTYVGNETKTLRFISAIILMVRSGAQWELLPERYGKWKVSTNTLPAGVIVVFLTKCAPTLPPISIWNFCWWIAPSFGAQLNQRTISSGREIALVDT